MEPIVTPRLNMRRLEASDAETIYAMASDPRIYRNVGRIEPNQTLDETLAFIQRANEGWDAGKHIVLAVSHGDTVIGVMGADETGVHGPIDLGYYIDPSHWNKGLATEAAGAFMAWLQSDRNIHALTAGYFLDNPSSGRVLSKLGFLPAGPRRYFCYGRDEFVDCMDMAWISDNA